MQTFTGSVRRREPHEGLRGSAQGPSLLGVLRVHQELVCAAFEAL